MVSLSYSSQFGKVPIEQLLEEHSLNVDGSKAV